MYIDRTVFIKVGYLLIVVIAGMSFLSLPKIIAYMIFTMIVVSLAIYFLSKRYLQEPAAVINITFLLALLDVLLITILVNFLGMSLYIIYSFYIVLGFMTLPRTKAFYLLLWISILYLGLIIGQYFSLFKPLIIFPPEEMTPRNLDYVLIMTIVYCVTLLFLSLRCYDFYKLISKKIIKLRNIQDALEDERDSLEIKVRARQRELEYEKRGLEHRIAERKKELQMENEKITERIEELERFKKVAADREKRTKELREKLLSFSSSKNKKAIG